MKSKLKTKREEAGMSQWELSQISDVNFRMIQFYEQGFKDINKAQATTLNRLAEALNCNIEDLIDKPKTRKEYLAIGKWDDMYNGAAIYSLVDQDGKRYIGQAKKLQNRLEQHRISLNNIVRNKNIVLIEGMEVCDAVASGKRFRVEILKKIEEEDDLQNELNYWEGYYFEKYGGFDGTYNSQHVKDYDHNKKYYNDIEYVLKLNKKTDADIIEYLDQQKNVNGKLKDIIREKIKE